MRSDNTRIFLADDHDILREGLSILLQKESDFTIVGEAGSKEEMDEKLSASKPDVLLLDVEMRGVNAIETISALKSECPDLAILVFSMKDSNGEIKKMLRSGAKGYILKSSGKDELVRAIRTLADGASYLGKDVSDIIFGSKHDIDHEVTPPDKVPLTARETEVLKLVARGLTNQQIGDRLHISPRTVGSHRMSIMVKLDLHNAAALSHYAAKNGLLD